MVKSMFYVCAIFTFSLIVANSAVFSPRRQCPNKDFCECNLETRKIECLCKQANECNARLSFANKSISEFREVYINNMPRFDRSFFSNTQFSPQFRLSLQSTRELGARFLADISSGLTLLEIIYFDYVRINARAFEGLKCETFSFISLGENTPLDLNTFGVSDDTRINSLLLDFHSTNPMSAVFQNSNPVWLEFENAGNVNLLTKEQLVELWSSRARIKKVYIQEVKGLLTLDHTWVPRFEGLDRIEIYYTDLNRIGRTFSLLHGDTLRFLSIRQSRLEILESRAFEPLSKLELLDLSSNPIKRIEREAFFGLSGLRTLTLQSIQETYTIGESDLCALSYLPCGIDVYLDNYGDENTVSCVLIFLHELRNDTVKFRSTVNSRLFKALPLNNIYYHRDVRCRIRDRISQCLRQAGRSGSKHCLANHLGLIDELPIMSESTSTRPSTVSTSTSTTVPSHSQFEKIRIDLANLTQQVETLKIRNKALNDLEKSLEKLNLTAHQIKHNLSELFELYETEYDSNLRLQHHLNELFSNYVATNTATTKATLKDLDNVTVINENELEPNENAGNKKSGEEPSFLDSLSSLGSIGSTDDSSSSPSSSSDKHTAYHKWIVTIILVLASFSIIQFILVVCVFYMFCKQRLYRAPPSAGGSGPNSRKVSDAAAVGAREGLDTADANIETIDSDKKEEIFKVEGNRGRDRLFMRTQDAKKPKFMPRRPVEFLRDSPVSLRNYNL